MQLVKFTKSWIYSPNGFQCSRVNAGDQVTLSDDLAEIAVKCGVAVFLKVVAPVIETKTEEEPEDDHELDHAPANEGKTVPSALAKKAARWGRK